MDSHRLFSLYFNDLHTGSPIAAEDAGALGWVGYRALGSCLDSDWFSSAPYSGAGLFSLLSNSKIYKLCTW